jgi:hypothetical protein
MDKPIENPVLAEFAGRIHRRYEPVLLDCMSLVRIGNELFRRDLEEPLHKVMRAIAKIVVNSNGAVLTLVTHGYGNDAMKIARSMFEGAATAAYLRRHPELVNDYLDYDSIRKWRLYEAMVARNPEYVNHLPQATVDDVRREYETVAPRFTRNGGRLHDSWRKDVSLHTIANEVDLGQFYAPFYGTASGIHHMDSTGLRAQGSPDVFDIEVAPSDRYVHVALSMSHNLTWRVLYEFNEEAHLGMNAELEAAKNAQIAAWERIRQ